jgi:hypothetical protein
MEKFLYHVPYQSCPVVQNDGFLIKAITVTYRAGSEVLTELVNATDIADVLAFFYLFLLAASVHE